MQHSQAATQTSIKTWQPRQTPWCTLQKPSLRHLEVRPWPQRACSAVQRHRQDLAAEAYAQHALPALRRRSQQRPHAHYPRLVAEGVRCAARHRDPLQEGDARVG